MLYSQSDLQKELAEISARLTAYLKQLRTGRASADVFEGAKVHVYGSDLELKGVAAVIVESATSVVINPFDKNVVADLLTSLKVALPNYNPVDEGGRIRINIPPMTEEVRLDTVKQMQLRLEDDFRKRIRQVRQDFMHHVERAEGVSEDQQTVAKKDIQKQIDAAMGKLDELADAKEAEIMEL